MKSFLFKNKFWIFPLLIMAIITPFTPKMDKEISHYFYDSTKSFSDAPFYTFIYYFGLIPGQIAFALSAILFILSFFFKRMEKWYKPSLIMILCLSIGSGLIAHAVFKDHWGRARPKQVIEFGGEERFTPYYILNLDIHKEPSKSFPCGHCTMGFYFFALCLIGYQTKNKTLFYSSLFLALFLGILLSLSRIAQGGHFFSDTLASALIMWLTSYICVKVIYCEENALK